jgi:hypothetical protein
MGTKLGLSPYGDEHKLKMLEKKAQRRSNSRLKKTAY